MLCLEGAKLLELLQKMPISAATFNLHVLRASRAFLILKWVKITKEHSSSVQSSLRICSGPFNLKKKMEQKGETSYLCFPDLGACARPHELGWRKLVIQMPDPCAASEARPPVSLWKGAIARKKYQTNAGRFFAQLGDADLRASGAQAAVTQAWTTQHRAVTLFPMEEAPEILTSTQKSWALGGLS